MTRPDAVPLLKQVGALNPIAAPYPAVVQANAKALTGTAQQLNPDGSWTVTGFCLDGSSVVAQVAAPAS